MTVQSTPSSTAGAELVQALRERGDIDRGTAGSDCTRFLERVERDLASRQRVAQLDALLCVRIEVLLRTVHERFAKPFHAALLPVLGRHRYGPAHRREVARLGRVRRHATVGVGIATAITRRVAPRIAPLPSSPTTSDCGLEHATTAVIMTAKHRDDNPQKSFIA
jgi:hypothetical protein